LIAFGRKRHKLKKAWEIVDNTADERIRLQALALIRECNTNRLEMITNGTVVSDALKYVNNKVEKLKTSESTAALEEEEEYYQTTVTEETETEETTN
jgi:hypothetical protein